MIKLSLSEIVFAIQGRIADDQEVVTILSRSCARKWLAWIVGLIIPLANGDVIRAESTQGNFANVMAMAFTHAVTFHIEPVRIRSLALSAVEGVTEIEARARIQHNEKAAHLLFDDMVVAAFPLPEDSNLAVWAHWVARVFANLRDISPLARDLSQRRLVEAAINNMLARLDRFSRYFGREEARREYAQREGYYGIGVRVRVRRKKARIVEVMRTSPAFYAGLKPDDVILSIDERNLSGLNQQQVTDLLQGLPGTDVRLVLDRPQEAAHLGITIRRDHIYPPTVAVQIIEGFAYIKIDHFNKHTAREIQGTVLSLRDDVQGFLIDLRGNRGGLMTQSVIAADLFIDSRDLVLSTRGRHPRSQQFFRVTPGDIALGLPVAVFINGDTASAAEVMALILQESGRASLIGVTSYGKGTVQKLLRLPNGGEIALTWARFLGKSGFMLDGIGITPQLCLSSKADDFEAMIADSEQRLALARELRSYHNPSEPKIAARIRQACSSRDLPPLPAHALAVARTLLSSPPIYRRMRDLGARALAHAP